MGNNNDKYDEVIYDLDPNKIQINIKRLNQLQDELEELKGDKVGENDMYQVFVNNVTNAVTQVVIQQVKIILMEFINGNKNVYEELYEKIYEVCANNTTIEINKLKIEMKKMETTFNQDKDCLEKELRKDNNIRYKKLKQDITKMESKLNKEMEEYEIEMKKINERFESYFPIVQGCEMIIQ